MQDIMQLCDVVRETGFAIHRYHKHGLLINFGTTKFEIKKYVLSRTGESSRPGSLIAGTLSLYSLTNLCSDPGKPEKYEMRTFTRLCIISWCATADCGS